MTLKIITAAIPATPTGRKRNIPPQIASPRTTRRSFCSIRRPEPIGELQCFEIEVGDISKLRYSAKRARRFDVSNENLMNNRADLYAPAGTSISSLPDLNGKTVAVSGRSAHTKALNRLARKSGVKSKSVVVGGFVNVFGIVSKSEADNGKGIPEDKRKQEFEEFYQLDNPARDRREELGLGLSIVDHVGRLLDHPVELSSSVGKGSMFSVELPLAKSGFSLPQTSTTRLEAAKIGILIALIDDEPDVLDALCMTLEASGYDVLAATTEEEMLTMLSSHDHSPHLIISDYRLRDGTYGTDAIKAIQNAVGEEIPAMIITGETSPDELKQAGKNGIRMLNKPVRLQVIAAEIAEKLDA